MKHLYTFIICLCCVSVFAEGMHIKGVIKDMDTQQPVSGAFILITFFKGVEFSDVTDSLGRYDITTKTLFPVGYYSVEIEAKNYNTRSGFAKILKESILDFTIKNKDPKVVTAAAPLILKPEPVKPVLEGYATNNLVFLIDISSSMNTAEKMPLLKESIKYLVNELRPTDRVAILTFSNFVKEVLPSTAATDKALITKTIDGLTFGSTSQGGAALDVAYKTALKNFVQKGNNRIVLASDGIFTSGEKDYKKMQQVIESGLDKNITLSVFCFGKNTEYVKTKLKKLTATGNGNFAIITSLEEGKQHMLEEAKAVKN
ncbi:MAG: VWA domain-containing protein [Sphingobacteriales bacterium]|nr:VWA domain-containing protein [Sphingobacteriales bacterium]